MTSFIWMLEQGNEFEVAWQFSSCFYVLSGEKVCIPGKDCGFMPQSLSLHEYLKGGECLTFYGLIYGMAFPDIKRKTKDLSEMLQIDKILDYEISTWSGGQQRRLSLACALIHSPKLLIL